MSGLNAPPNDVQQKVVEGLQIECQTLRDRVKELTDRLESEDSRQTVHQLEQQRRRIAALEAVTEVYFLFFYLFIWDLAILSFTQLYSPKLKLNIEIMYFYSNSKIIQM